MTFKFNAMQAALLGALSAVTLAGPVLAQSSDSQRLERVEVTGSNIKRVDTETASPVQVITRTDIEKTGYTTVTQLLGNLPGNNSGNLTDAQTNSFATGAGAVSLRGLGAQATLILLNGRRLANYGFANGGQFSFVDLNTIPLDVVERVEVLRDGASAIYGSEAIAGVINIILRRDFTGISLTATAGISAQNDGREIRASGTVGYGDLVKDRFNVFLNVEGYKRNPIYQRDRDYYVNSLDRRGIGYIDGRSTFSYPGNYYTGTGANGGGAFIAQIRPGTCDPSLISNGGATGIAAGRCLLDADQYITAVPKSKRENAYSRLNFQITPSILAFVELGRSETKTTQFFNPTAVTTWLIPNPALPGGVILDSTQNIILPANYPGNQTGVAVTPRYAFGDVGPRSNKVDSVLERGIAGLTGSFGSWDWDTAVGYVRNATDNRQNGYINATYFRSLVANRQYVFGNPAANNPAIYANLSPEIKREGISTSKYVDGKITGELFNLPAGPLALATGFEYRKERLTDIADPLVSSGQIIGLGASGANGDRSVTSFYGELSIPVLKNLEAQLALRHDHFSDYGNSTTPKVGLKFTPIKELALRGTYSQGFRAPSLPEISKSVLTGFYNGQIDPARCNTPALIDCNVSIPAVIGANPALQPEKSRSYTLGFVADPFESLTASMDYYWVNRRNEITALDITTLLGNEAAYPGKVFRAPPQTVVLANGTSIVIPGAIQYVNLQYANLGKTETRGVDLDLTHRLDMGAAGKLTTTLNANYVIDYDVQTTQGGDYTHYNSSHNQPRKRGNLSFTHEIGAVRTFAKVNYVGSFDYRGGPPNDCTLQAAGFPQFCSIGSYTTVDLGVSFTGIKNLRLYANVLNVLDTKPPVDLNYTGNYDYNYHSLVGRFFSGGATYTFN